MSILWYRVWREWGTHIHIKLFVYICSNRNGKTGKRQENGFMNTWPCFNGGHKCGFYWMISLVLWIWIRKSSKWNDFEFSVINAESAQSSTKFHSVVPTTHSFDHSKWNIDLRALRMFSVCAPACACVYAYMCLSWSGVSNNYEARFNVWWPLKTRHLPTKSMSISTEIFIMC